MHIHSIKIDVWCTIVRRSWRGSCTPPHIAYGDAPSATQFAVRLWLLGMAAGIVPQQAYLGSEMAARQLQVWHAPVSRAEAALHQVGASLGAGLDATTWQFRLLGFLMRRTAQS